MIEDLAHPVVMLLHLCPLVYRLLDVLLHLETTGVGCIMVVVCNVLVVALEFRLGFTHGLEALNGNILRVDTRVEMPLKPFADWFQLFI